VISGVSYKATSALAHFEVSATGSVVVFRPSGANETRLVWFDRRGQEIGVTGPRGSYEQPRISPDNRRIAFTREDNETGNRDIWSIEIERGVAARITTHPANDWFPVWSPDGKRILFGSDRDGTIEMPPFIKESLEVSSGERRLLPGGALTKYSGSVSPYDWSPDGRWLLLGSSDIWLAPVSGSREPFPFLATRFDEGGARFSRDGEWIAYTSDETGRSEVYVRPFSDGTSASDGKIQVSNDGGDFPVWRRDGQELFYIAGDLHLYSVNTTNFANLGGAPSAPTRLFRPCADTDLWATPLRNEPYVYQYDTVDGRRFVFNCRAEPSGRLIVLVNWKPKSQ
jgi:Tol biopolymer transport system component